MPHLPFHQINSIYLFPKTQPRQPSEFGLNETMDHNEPVGPMSNGPGVELEAGMIGILKCGPWSIIKSSPGIIPGPATSMRQAFGLTVPVDRSWSLGP